MSAPGRPASGIGWRHGAGAVLLLGGLAAVVTVHLAGQTLLAVVGLLAWALAAWTYTSPRTHALRYLFPGVAAALVFVVFPMLVTIGLGFTNRSSSNLLDAAQARAQLLDEATVDRGSQRPYELVASPAGTLRIVLPPHEGQAGWITEAFVPAAGAAPQPLLPLRPLAGPLPEALSMRDKVDRLDALRLARLTLPDGAELRPLGLREVAAMEPVFEALPDGALRDRRTQRVYRPDASSGFFIAADGERLQPGYVVAVGLAHYARLFTDAAFRAPFAGVFGWTVAFSALSVALAAALGLLLATLLNWPDLRGRGLYRVVLFLPYAVPGFISILVFKGLFNQNLGEVNLVLDALFGVKPAWFSDPLLARVMLLVVNVWLGFPYMMVLCSGLIQSIPADLYEASAVAGAGPWANFSRITLPLIVRPLTPLLIAAFAFNFNNFVLVSLLTGGRPDRVDATLPAGTTDILVTYTWRIAFQDGGQQFGLAAAISTVVFAIVAAITLLQMRATRRADAGP